MQLNAFLHLLIQGKENETYISSLSSSWFNFISCIAYRACRTIHYYWYRRRYRRVLPNRRCNLSIGKQRPKNPRYTLLCRKYGGSIYNINTIRAGELDLAIAQSDWQHHAYNGTNLFEEKGPFKSLRSVFSLHAEPFTVVARADSGIKTFDDLKGKRVNIGNPGSGQRGTMEVLMKAKGWTMKDFKLVSELKASEQSKALCDNKIDAMIYTVGHPSGAIKEATTSCSSVIVEVSGPVIDKLVDENAFYRIVTIPGGMYTGSENGVTTFGVGATFVSSTQVDNDVIYAVTQSVFDNFNEFKRLHPAFSGLKKKK